MMLFLKPIMRVNKNSGLKVHKIWTYLPFAWLKVQDMYLPAFRTNLRSNRHIASVHEKKKPFFKQSYEETYCIYVHEKRKPFNCKICFQTFFQNYYQIYILLQFMMIRSLWNVNFVALLILVKVIWIHILPQFMKKKCIFCYISVSQKGRNSAYNILYKYIPAF